VAADPWAGILRGLHGDRSDLVPALQRAQAALGYLPPEAVRRIARRLKLTESEVFGVATFYAQFRFTPPGRHRLPRERRRADARNGRAAARCDRRRHHGRR